MNQDEQWQFLVTENNRIKTRLALLEADARYGWHMHRVRVENEHDAEHVEISRMTVGRKALLLLFFNMCEQFAYDYLLRARRTLTHDPSTPIFSLVVPAPFRWDYDRTEDSQAGAYGQWLRDLIQTFTSRYHVIDIHNRPNTLSVEAEDAHGHLLLPFSLGGTTDALIQADSDELDLEQAVIVCQVKKLITPGIYNTYIAQSTAELIALETKVPNKQVPTFGLLTDLGNNWTFLWLAHIPGGTGNSTRTFCQLQLPSFYEVRALFNILNDPRATARNLDVVSLQAFRGAPAAQPMNQTD